MGRGGGEGKGDEGDKKRGGRGGWGVSVGGFAGICTQFEDECWLRFTMIRILHCSREKFHSEIPGLLLVSF